MATPQGRHEYKHILTYFDYLTLRSRVAAVAKPDKHARPDGVYFIRSLYFDNYRDMALREKLDGVDCREKFRIRLYNQDKSFIRLEKKSKRQGICFKENAPLTEQECRWILEGKWDFLQESDRALHRELYSKIQIQQLRPKTVVDYLREPYVYEPGNVRITFDSDIRTGGYDTDFLQDKLVTVRPAGGAIVMEVKFDRFLPSVIRDVVGFRDGASVSFSKYVVCRRI